MRKLKLLLLSATIVSLAIPATAARVNTPPLEPPTGLQSFLEDLPEYEAVNTLQFYDMSSNGEVEALLFSGEDCAEAGCTWQLIALEDDGWRVIGQGIAHDVFFQETEGGGAVVNADGITWAYSGGGAVYMWGDRLHDLRASPTSKEDVELVTNSSRYELADKIRLDRFDLDLNADGVDEHIYLVGGLYYSNSAGTPYLIFDQAGDLLIEGVSTDWPRIFPTTDGVGSMVVEVVPAGIRIQEIR